MHRPAVYGMRVIVSASSTEIHSISSLECFSHAMGTYDSDPNNEETNHNTNNGEQIAANKRPRRNEDAPKKITVIEI